MPDPRDRFDKMSALDVAADCCSPFVYTRTTAWLWSPGYVPRFSTQPTQACRWTEYAARGSRRAVGNITARIPLIARSWSLSTPIALRAVVLPCPPQWPSSPSD